MAKTDAKKAYENAKADIAGLMGFFECELSKEPKDIHWAHAGTLNKVRGDLVSTLAFLSGFSEDQINDTLIENRMLDEADADIETERKNA